MTQKQILEKTEKECISPTEYVMIHTWIRKNFGKADHCENIDCLGKSKFFDWALKAGLKYEKNRDNYLQLCKSCHNKIDCTTRKRQKLREFYLGKTKPKRLITCLECSKKVMKATSGKYCSECAVIVEKRQWSSRTEYMAQYRLKNRERLLEYYKRYSKTYYAKTH